jgi:hypothetical protein
MADEKQLKSSGLVALKVHCPEHWDPKIVLGRLQDFVLSSQMPGWAFPECFEISMEHEQCTSSTET